MFTLQRSDKYCQIQSVGSSVGSFAWEFVEELVTFGDQYKSQR